MAEVVLESTLTCPFCGHVRTETMPTDACQWFYECPNCRQRLKPKPGDCCVFCSYGSVPCPPTQEFIMAYVESWTRKPLARRFAAHHAADPTIL